jgi:hypothetical protein
MSKQTISTIQNWFSTGKKPTQAQFWDWLDSFFHKDDDIPRSQVEGLQELLDTKMDIKQVVTSEQVGTYNSEKNYVYDTGLAEYVSYKNSESTIKQFQTEGFYRLKENAPAGENPETNPEHWAYQGGTIGDITIEDVVGLREELDDNRKLTNNHINESSNAHAASAIKYDNGTSGLDASTAQAAIDELAQENIEQNINIVSPEDWDGTLYKIDLSSNKQIGLKVNNSVTSIALGLTFPDDASEISREAVVIIDNSENTSAISTITFDDNSGAHTWHWSVGDPVTGIAAGAKAELWVRSRSNTEVKALTDVGA